MFVLGSDGSLGAAINYCFGEGQGDRSSSVVSSEDVLAWIFNSNYSLSFSGSSGGGDGPPGAAHVAIEQFIGHIAQLGLVGKFDVCEIFGGVGGVGGLCVRRRLHSGEKLYLCTGFDLTKPAHQRIILDYCDKYKPSVAIFAPPCVSCGHWSHLSKVLHPATYEEFRRTGELLAAFAARMLRLQLDANRHLLLENPAGSGIFQLFWCWLYAPNAKTPPQKPR